MLGNTKHNLFSICRLFASFFHLLVNVLVFKEVNQCSRKEFCISVIFDTDFLQHLTNDNFDMLIVDFYTLQTVYTLYLAEHVILNCTDTFDL